MATDDYRPRLAFRVGVTGCRTLDTATCQADPRPRVREVLERFRHLAQQAATESQGFYDDNAPPILRAISPLEERADRIFAQEALDLGYELECPLAFEIHEYQNELRARAAAIFELGYRKADPHACEENPAPYKAAGHMVLDQCDVLMAIWDGGEIIEQFIGEFFADGTICATFVTELPPVPNTPPASPMAAPADRTTSRGNVDIVGEAKRRGIPVVWLDPDSEKDRILTSGGDSSDPAYCGGFDEQLRDMVWRLLIPPPNLERADSLTLWERRLAPALGWICQSFERVMIPGGRSEGPAVAFPESPATRGFESQFRIWDRLANQLAGLYRGAFLINYVLGVFAVFLAIFGESAKWPYLSAFELAAIGIIMMLVSFLHRKRWQLRTADCRYLAEHFRVLCYSYSLGLSPRRRDLPAHYLHAELRDRWVDWHWRSRVRLTPMPTGKLVDCMKKDFETIRRWVQGQADYHARNAAKLEKIDRRIHTLCWGLFVAVLVACFCHLAASGPWIRDRVPFTVLDIGRWRWLLLVTAGFPAASAAAHAISTQGEFRRLLDRSRSMTRRLQSYLDSLDGERGSSPASFRRQTDDLAQVLLDEVADWQILYRKPVPPPA